jgi:hypothetical protein
LGCEGGREVGEDVGELAPQQRGGDVGRDEVEEVDGRSRRVFVGDALLGDLAGKQRQQCGEVGSRGKL